MFAGTAFHCHDSQLPGKLPSCVTGWIESDTTLLFVWRFECDGLLQGPFHVEKPTADKEVKVRLERKEDQGPMHTVFRVDGRYLNAQGQSACRWTIRYRFFAGRPAIGITHSFTWIGEPEKVKIKDLGEGLLLAWPALPCRLRRRLRTNRGRPL
ncbi:MAG: exo-rhamnogalacturonan lyase family protein [Planctomycetota bacterium]|jgi:hypothetical protein